MPLPIATAATRASKLDNSSKSTRLRSPLQKASVKLKQDNVKTEEQTANSYNDELDSSTTTGSVTVSQVPSRIPSPLKRPQPDLPTHGQQTKSSQHSHLGRGHARQKSVATAPTVPQASSKHARSISSISVKSTTGISYDARLSQPKPGNSTRHVQPGKPGPTLIRPTFNAPRSGTQPGDTYPNEEGLRNELFQLSLVYAQSGKTLQTYQQILNKLVATQQAQVHAKKAVVLQLKLANSAVANVSALGSWVKVSSQQTLGQFIQDLSVVVKDVYTLEQIFMGDGGLTWAFDEWYQGITTPSDQVVSDLQHHNYTSLHLKYRRQLLPELQRFERRTASSLAMLANLPYLPDSSSLAFTVQSHTSLLKSFQSQCQTMLQLGQHLVAEHQNWLETEVATAIEDYETSSRTNSLQTVGLWET